MRVAHSGWCQMKISCHGKPDYPPEVAAEAAWLALQEMCAKMNMPAQYLRPRFVEIELTDNTMGSEQIPGGQKLYMPTYADRLKWAHEWAHVFTREWAQTLYHYGSGEHQSQAVERYLRSNWDLWRKAKEATELREMER
jgi:hypothetical protein